MLWPVVWAAGVWREEQGDREGAGEDGGGWEWAMGVGRGGGGMDGCGMMKVRGG